jgi:hypothetical protein
MTTIIFRCAFTNPRLPYKHEFILKLIRYHHLTSSSFTVTDNHQHNGYHVPLPLSTPRHTAALTPCSAIRPHVLPIASNYRPATIATGTNYPPDPRQFFYAPPTMPTSYPYYQMQSSMTPTSRNDSRQKDSESKSAPRIKSSRIANVYTGPVSINYYGTREHSSGTCNLIPPFLD